MYNTIIVWLIQGLWRCIVIKPKKRTYGRGSIYYVERRKCYCGQVFVDIGNGQTQRKTVYGNTQRAVKDKMLEMQYQSKAGAFIHKEKSTIYTLASNLIEEQFALNEIRQTSYDRKIETLKSTIKKVKKTKETINGDQKHANAVAEIFAAQTVKKLMMENISVKDKIKVFEEKIKSKKEELAYLKKNIHIDQVYFEDRLDIDEESKEDENDGEDTDNPDQEQEDNYVDSV